MNTLNNTQRIGALILAVGIISAVAVLVFASGASSAGSGVKTVDSGGAAKVVLPALVTAARMEKPKPKPKRPSTSISTQTSAPSTPSYTAPAPSNGGGGGSTKKKSTPKYEAPGVLK